MEPMDCMERVYEECKAVGLRAVAGQLGLDCQQLLAQLHDAGVMRGEGCPSQREIAERCRDVRLSWSDERPGAEGIPHLTVPWLNGHGE
jgi:hypothetical protein